MNRDLFLAILSMDSYNRGYGQSVKGLADTGSIGSASIGVNSSILLGPDDQREDIPAGFYAIAYDVSGVAGIAAGTRVVMYRGSDIFLFGNTLFDGDVLNGYGGAAGDVYSPQALLALKFTNSATGRVPINSTAIAANAAFEAGIAQWRN